MTYNLKIEKNNSGDGKNDIDDDFLDLEFNADPSVFILFWNLEFL